MAYTSLSKILHIHLGSEAWTSSSAGSHGPGTLPGWPCQTGIAGNLLVDLLCLSDTDIKARIRASSPILDGLVENQKSYSTSHQKKDVWKIKGFVADGKDVSPEHWKASCIRSTLNPQNIEAKLAVVQRFSLFPEIQNGSWKINFVENEPCKNHMHCYEGQLQTYLQER